MNEALRSRIDRAANVTLFTYAATAMALPVCLVQIKQEIGFNLTQAGALGCFSTAEQFILLIFSSFIAVRFGKVLLLKASLAVVGVGLLLFTRVWSYATIVICILIIGLGYGFIEALLTPLVEDLYPEDNGSKQNLLHSFWPVGVLVSTLTVGELLSRGCTWRLIFLGMIAMTIAAYFIYPPVSAMPRKKAQLDFSHLGEILGQPKFRVLGMALFFAGGAEGGLTYWLASYIQLHFGAEARAGALGAACFALGMLSGRFSASKLAHRWPLRRMIQGSALLATVCGCAFFAVSELWSLYISVFLAGLTIACFWPSLQTYAARALPVDPTLLMTLMSCFGMTGFSSATLGMGIIGDLAGMRASFVLVPLYLIALLAMTLLEQRTLLRK